MTTADPAALLVVDIGTLFTHVALLELVAGEYRLLGRAQALSTLEPPIADAWQGILTAIREIEQLTFRAIAHVDGLMTPHRPDGSGVDGMVVSTSAAGTLPIVLAAISNDTTGASLRRVARSSYTTVLDMVTLDEYGDPDLAEGESWIDYQLANLVRLPAATVLMAGGIDGGNSAPLERLAHMLGFTVLRLEQINSREFAHVIFAGNTAAYPGIEDALSTIAPITATSNVLPAIGVEQLMPARLELIRSYNDRVLPKLPSFNRMRAMSSDFVRSTSDGFGPLVRFIAKHHGRNTLIVDIGAMTSAGYASDGTQLHITVETNCGTAYGIAGLVDQAGPSNITRWLPFEMSDSALREHMLNRLIRPQIVPIDRESLLIEQALVREALRVVSNDLFDEQPQLASDLIIATGGPLAHTIHPAQALLSLVDGLDFGRLQQYRDRSLLISDIYLDRDGLLALAGATAWKYPDASFCLLEQDILRNGALASYLLINSSLRLGDLVAEVELVPVSGAPIIIQIHHGEIRRLPLAHGKRATLRLRPTKQVQIGANLPGEVVETALAAITGSTLGLVIDARPRPLAQRNSDAQSRNQQWQWLNQLGVVDGLIPYAPQSDEQPLPAFEPIPAISRIPEPAPAAAQMLPEREEPNAIPDWLREEGENANDLAMPAPSEFGVEEPLPDWLSGLDVPVNSEPVLDLGERQASQPVAPADFSALRSELEEQNKPKRGFFRRK
ncbi:glutamate mutase L [Herpetosiphon sp. NSE202]|uniref:glutamate mutase L n=1 Tax=Herpetosiphon sp. NSE202 TaxID=3351349 RepID=UPI0036432270